MKRLLERLLSFHEVFFFDIKNEISQIIQNKHFDKTLRINVYILKIREKLPKTARSKDNLRAVFDYIEQYPIIDIKRTAKELDISYNTVATAVKKLVELGILQETTNAARNRVFAYEEYLGILMRDT